MNTNDATGTSVGGARPGPSGASASAMDAVTSALNAGCRAQLDNLYIGDRSVFPSVAAKNWGLTAMANALRVGDHLPGLTRGKR